VTIGNEFTLLAFVYLNLFVAVENWRNLTLVAVALWRIGSQ